MMRVVALICGPALLLGFGAANSFGVCVPEFKQYSDEEALIFALHHATNSRDYIIPEIKTMEDARNYLDENPDCCIGSRSVDPVRMVLGIHRGVYAIDLPSSGGARNLYSEFTYELTNCLRIRKAWEIGNIKE